MDSKEIVKNIDIPIQFGGGVRSINTIEALLDCGIRRVVLGTKAIEDENFLKNSFKKFKERVIVSIDVKSNNILIKGWQASSKKKGVLDFIRRLKDLGSKEIIYTDTLKDGTLTGPNIKEIKNILSIMGR